MIKKFQLEKYKKLLKDIKELEKGIADESLPVGYDSRLKSAELEAVRTIRHLVDNIVDNLDQEIERGE